MVPVVVTMLFLRFVSYEPGEGWGVDDDTCVVLLTEGLILAGSNTSVFILTLVPM